MKPIKYSKDYREKLISLTQYLDREFGVVSRKQVLRTITDRINQLSEFEYLGQQHYDYRGELTEFRMIHVSHNYVFYQVREDCIWIVNMYHEREDYMQAMYGVSSISQETEDYWKE